MRKLLLAFLTVVLMAFPSMPANALNAALVPTFGPVQSTAGGFVVEITNYDASYTWTPIASNCGNAVVSSSGFLTVTGINARTSSSVTLYTDRSGYTQGSANISGTSGDFTATTNVSTDGQNSWANKILTGTNGDIYSGHSSWTPSGSRANVERSLDHGKSWANIASWPSGSGTGFGMDLSGSKLATVWMDGANGNTGIKSSFSADGGITWTTPTQVETNGAIYNPEIAITGDGNLIAAWYQYTGGLFKIQTRISTDNGATWGTIATQSGTDSGYSPTFKRLSNGDVLLIWNNGSAPVGTQLTDTTNTWGAKSQLSNRTSYQGGGNAVLVDGTRLAVVWAEGAGPYSIMLSFFDGAAWSTPVTVNNAGLSVLNPRIAVSPSNIVVTFASGTTSYVARSSLASISFSAAQNISGSSTYVQNPTVTWVSGNKFAASFMQGGLHATINNLVPQITISNDNGATWGTPFSDSSVNLQNYGTNLITDSAGVLVHIWQIQNPNVVIKATAIDSMLPAEAAKEAYLVADTNQGSGHSHVYAPTVYGGKIYYSATTSSTGREIFVYDGSTVQLLADLNPGTGNGAYDSNGIVGVYNNKLLFIGDNGTTGMELYTYDGTTIALVANIRAGTTGSSPSNFKEYNGRLYFSATVDSDSQSYGWEWDYTNPPRLLSAAYAGYTRQYFQSPAVVAGNLYFSSRVIGQSIKLTKFDGTTFTEIATAGTSPNFLAALGNRLIFSQNSTNEGVEPWVYDGTSDSLVADIKTGSASGNPTQYNQACSGVFFTSYTTSNGREIFYWNTMAGNPPSMIADINPGIADSMPGYQYADSNGVYFQASDGTNGAELWFTDGTTATRLTDANAGSASFSPSSITKLGSTLYMGGVTAANGAELYAYGVKPAGFTPAIFAQTYVITYDANTGTGSATQSAASGSVSLNSGSVFNKSGKILLGWNTNPAATTASYSLAGSYNLTASVTLYAIWGDPPATNPQPAPAPDIPTPADLKKQIGNVPTDGGPVTFNVKNIGVTNKAFIQDQSAIVDSATTETVTLKLPKMSAGTYDLTLITNIGTYTFSGAVTYVNVAGKKETSTGTWNKESFEVQGFKTGSSKLNASMRSSLEKRIYSSKATIVNCIGHSSGPTILKSDRALATARAKAVCAIIAKKLGALGQSISIVNNKKIGEKYRRVQVDLLTKLN